MRDCLELALTRYSDYPPGFRPCDFEPRLNPRNTNQQQRWNRSRTLIHPDLADWQLAKLGRLQHQLICLRM